MDLRLRGISVAERSFSFLDCMKMSVKPTSQPLLSQSRQLQDKMGKIQGLEDFKIPPCIRNDMRAAATQLFKRQGLPRFVSKPGTRLRVGKEMVQTITQDYGDN